MQIITGQLTHFVNPSAHRDNVYSEKQREILDIDKSHEAIETIRLWPGYSVTPLYSLGSMAQDADLGKIWYKDESKRFDLKSFKALGGAYAVIKQLQRALESRLGKAPDIKEILAGKWRKEISEITVSCATDGNHGRSVAWGARLFGCSSVIYIHRDVSEGRKECMESFGAKVIRIEGNYDDSVKVADAEAKSKGYIIVSDTSYPGYTEVPKDVALGYTAMLSELVSQLEGDIPTHVFIQGGVGGLASTVCGYFWQIWGADRPRFSVVEPEQANCLQESAKAGKPVQVEGSLTTLMAGLACGEVSILAWEILKNGSDDFMTVSENTVPETMRLLAKGYKDDPAIEAGESAVPSLSAALLARADKEIARKMGLDSSSKVLIIGTEGATDPDLYQKLVYDHIDKI